MLHFNLYQQRIIKNNIGVLNSMSHHIVLGGLHESHFRAVKKRYDVSQGEFILLNMHTAQCLFQFGYTISAFWMHVICLSTFSQQPCWHLGNHKINPM